MQSKLDLFRLTQRLGITGLLTVAAALPVSAAAAQGDTYTWSAELVALDAQGKTMTVQAPLVSNADVDFGSLDAGDRVTLTWSGINTAAGVRRITDGPAGDDWLALPVEFVSAELDNRYVRFEVAVPSGAVPKLSKLAPGQYVTATSPRRATRFEEAVVEVRPYNDVG